MVPPPKWIEDPAWKMLPTCLADIVQSHAGRSVASTYRHFDLKTLPMPSTKFPYRDGEASQEETPPSLPREGKVCHALEASEGRILGGLVSGATTEVFANGEARQNRHPSFRDKRVQC